MSKHPGKFTTDKPVVDCLLKANLGYKPYICSVVRGDGGQTGQGKRLLNEEIVKYIANRWTQTMQKTYGIKSYKEFRSQCSFLCIKYSRQI